VQVASAKVQQFLEEPWVQQFLGQLVEQLLVVLELLEMPAQLQLLV
jgi:hypothetical protein